MSMNKAPILTTSDRGYFRARVASSRKVGQRPIGFGNRTPVCQYSHAVCIQVVSRDPTAVVTPPPSWLAFFKRAPFAHDSQLDAIVVIVTSLVLLYHSSNSSSAPLKQGCLNIVPNQFISTVTQ